MSKILVSFLLAFVFVSPAQADYVLPYPSFMPGHKLYRLSRMIDSIKRYWYWGNMASYRYYLTQSDKALVEAKTLFEYGQYLLAIDALKRSNDAVVRAPAALNKAKQEGKAIDRYERELIDAKRKHTEIITKLKVELPQEFTWRPERANPTQLHIAESLDTALRTRQ